MPFITKDRREKINNCTLDSVKWTVGDECYYYYQPMVEKWKANPRWTTAHNIFISLLNAPACQLAWQVFFQLHVIPYELKKREENGDI